MAGSMKDEAMAEVTAMFERSQSYQEGYKDGFSEGYDRARQDMRKLNKLAFNEMMKGFYEATGSRTMHENGVRV